jgi:cation:H+ antiporter
MVSATSAVIGHGEIAYGNAIGSIICNTALIAAITVAIRPPKVDGKSLSSSVLFFFIAAIAYSAIAVCFRSFSRVSGILFLLLFIVYIVMTVLQARRDSKANKQEDGDAADDGKPLWKQIVLLIIGAALIAWGADLLVKNATIIAKAIGIPESVIGLTLVALGTSLPELVTAITSLVKGHSSLSLGNIIGANFFNIVLVSGVATTLSPFDVPQGKTIGAYPTSLVVDIPVMLFVMALLTLPPILAGKMSRVQGILLLAIYAAFCVFQFAF